MTEKIALTAIAAAAVVGIAWAIAFAIKGNVALIMGITGTILIIMTLILALINSNQRMAKIIEVQSKPASKLTPIDLERQKMLDHWESEAREWAKNGPIDWIQ
jgi:hypothetical protein